MFSRSLPNNYKTLISIVFSILHLSLPTFLKFYKGFQASVLQNKVSSFDGVGKGNTDPSTLLGNVQQNVVNIWKTVICIVLCIIVLSLPTYLESVFPLFWYDHSKFINIFLDNVKWKDVKHLKAMIYILSSIMQLSLPTFWIFRRNAFSNVFGIQNNYFGMINLNSSLF